MANDPDSYKSSSGALNAMPNVFRHTVHPERPSDTKHISIVIPAFNESGRIAVTLETIWRYFNDKSHQCEIIVVDDASSDNTYQIVSHLSKSLNNLTLLRLPSNKGKGASIRQGILSSSGELVLICDADLSTPIEEIEKLYPWIERGYAIALGSRALKDSVIVRAQSWYRRNMGKTFNVFVQLLVMRGIRDTQCGFKLFTGEAARELFSRSKINRFCFDVEILFLARKAGLGIKEVPITWINSPDSRVRLFVDSFLMLMDLWRIRIYDIFGMYKND